MDKVRYKAATVVEYLAAARSWMRHRVGLKPLYHCPNCSAALIAARFSRYVNERCVSNFWSCDACGHEHETSAVISHGSNHRSADIRIDF
jgi:predicted RNA-binding Zn-ribbon protein involved in translation (DUF1610 family)